VATQVVVVAPQALIVKASDAPLVDTNVPPLEQPRVETAAPVLASETSTTFPV
jgi:hypothetical protein